MCKFAVFILAVVAGCCSVTLASERLTVACQDVFEYMNQTKEEFRNEEGFPQCSLEMEATYYPKSWKDIPALFEGMMKMHSEVPEEERRACAMQNFKWMHANPEKMKSMIEGIKGSVNDGCIEKFKEIIGKVMNEL